MKLCKGAETAPAAPDAGDLAAINRYTRRALTAEEVYCFAVKLCDNEVDRDGERFTVAALQGLSQLFVGCTGIFDHNWSAGGQKARIYRTELIADDTRKTAVGERYTALKAWAYMLRTEENAGLIAEIEGGIKKEVSVGCSVAGRRCSICGESRCAHVPGEVYDGRLCCMELSDPTDAYEWSFVAVPAQREAGVTKGREGPVDIRGLCRLAGPGHAAALKQLEAEAALGRRWLEETRREVLRLGLLTGCWEDGDLLEKAVQKLDGPELGAFRAAFTAQAAEKLPLTTQIRQNSTKTDEFEEDFRI